MHTPGPKIFDVAYKILRYLKGTPRKCLLVERHGHLQVEVYIDVDWARSITNRRSTSGYCTFVRPNLVTWHSKKQPVVARSSVEVEFRVLDNGILKLFGSRGYWKNYESLIICL